ncbi:MAG: hypothetical protein IKF79_00475 [Methanosphaera sp.]|nr:hypothetical protein [Methanosphaera sp.]
MNTEEKKCCKNDEKHDCDEKHANGECCKDNAGHEDKECCKNKEGHGQGNCNKNEGHSQGHQRGGCCRRRRARMQMMINNKPI